jgi:hypothetical protein
VHLARHAVYTETVGPVRRDLELEHVGGDRQHLGQRRPGHGTVVEHDDALVGRADRQLVLGEDHALRLDPAQARGAQLVAVGQHRTGQGDGDGLALGHVGGAAHDLVGSAVAHVDAAHPQAVGVGMRPRLEHAADHVAIGRADAVAKDTLDLGPGEVEALDELRRRQRRTHVVLEPEAGHEHQPNCSRKRTSFS